MRSLLLSMSLSLRLSLPARATAPLARRFAPGAALLRAPQPHGSPSLSSSAAAGLLFAPRRGFAASLAAPATRRVAAARSTKRAAAAAQSAGAAAGAAPQPSQPRIIYSPDQNARWSAQLALLCDYAAAHGGSTDVQKRYVTPDGHALGEWANKQRALRNAGALGAERVAALEALGFDWHPMDTVWRARYEELVAYAAAHGGSTAVPNRQLPLGRWLQEQRALWRKGTLPAERVEKLAALGVTKEPLPSANAKRGGGADAAASYANERDAEQWRAMLAALRAYADAHGGATTVPADYPPNPELGFWVTRQRCFRKQGTLPPALVAALDELRFVWDVKQALWQQRRDELAAYKAAHGGRTDVPKHYADNPRLGAWLVGQRAEWRKGELAAERVAALQALGVTNDVMRG
jgi:hypothetical protein